MSRRGLPRRPDPSREDGGYTLVEMLVAMTLMATLIAIFMAGIVQMTKATVRVENVSDSTDEARRAFSRMDLQLPYASAVNRPVRVGDDWYLEFRTTPTETTTGLCAQWRLVNSSHLLQYRTWSDVANPTVPDWITIASQVRNNPSTQVPFLYYPAGGSWARQRIFLYLYVTNGQPGSAWVYAHYVARNTSTATVTNPDSNPADGISDTQVCEQVGRS